jgi:hypothetical protein
MTLPAAVRRVVVLERAGGTVGRLPQTIGRTHAPARGRTTSVEPQEVTA